MKRTNWKQGTTMVEVIVAFAVLILIMGIFSQAVSLTGRMMNRADDTLKGYRNMEGEYYLEELPLEDEDPIELSFRSTKDGSEFRVSAILRKFSNTDGSLYDVVVNP